MTWRVPKLRFHLPYAIPAIISAAAMLLVAFTASALARHGRDGLTELARNSQRHSEGRVYTMLLVPQEEGATLI